MSSTVNHAFQGVLILLSDAKIYIARMNVLILRPLGKSTAEHVVNMMLSFLRLCAYTKCIHASWRQDAHVCRLNKRPSAACLDMFIVQNRLCSLAQPVLDMTFQGTTYLQCISPHAEPLTISLTTSSNHVEASPPPSPSPPSD